MLYIREKNPEFIDFLIFLNIALESGLALVSLSFFLIKKIIYLF